MTLLNGKSWLLLALILVCAGTGGVASLLQLWPLAACSAFGLLFICGVLTLLQTPRTLKVSRSIINRLEQVQDLQRQSNRSNNPGRTSSIQQLATLQRKETTRLKQQLKDTERRLLSVEENAAYASDRDAHEILLLLRRIEKQLADMSPSVTN